MPFPHHTDPLRRAALLASCLTGIALASPARAADAAGWTATATQAFVPALLAPRTGATAATLAFQQRLRTAAASATDVAASAPITVTVALKLRNEAELDAHNRSGAAPLSAAEILARFAPTEAQVAAVVAHLRSAGFTGIEVAPNRLLITATGTGASVQTAFHTGLSQFTFDNRAVFANKSAALVPAALAGTVGSVLGLQDVVRPRTMLYRGPSRTTPQAQAAQAPLAGTRATASTVAHSPTDFAKIYDASSVSTGSKTAVGIITWGSLTKVITDLKSFTTNAGLPTQTTTTVKTASNGSYVVDADSDGEWCLDSQTIVGTSGGVSQLYFYTAPNGGNGPTDAGITAAYNRAVSDNVVKVINVSLGEDETASNSSGTRTADDSIFKTAVAQGQTFSVSSGDEGVYESTGGVITDANGNINTDLSKYSVSEPAISPNVIAVGGTTLSTTSTTTWAGETVWNEGLAYVNDYDYTERLWATGGGVSVYETAPSWQTSALGSAVTKRVLPDIAFDAAQVSGAKIIVHGATEQIGGTSLASPIFVGLWARLESANGNALKFPASSFYSTFPTQTSLLHDVTSGNNGYNGYGYKAGTGYDKTTGFGSFDTAKLATYISNNASFAR